MTLGFALTANIIKILAGLRKTKHRCQNCFSVYLNAFLLWTGIYLSFMSGHREPGWGLVSFLPVQSIALRKADKVFWPRLDAVWQGKAFTAHLGQVHLLSRGFVVGRRWCWSHRGSGCCLSFVLVAVPCKQCLAASCLSRKWETCLLRNWGKEFDLGVSLW